MPFVSEKLLRAALQALGGQHPLLLFSLPAMTRTGVPSAATQEEADANPVRFGGTQERELLDHFFRVDGAKEKTPYWSPSAGDFVSARYAETSLQRQRKDKAKPTDQQIFFETGGRQSRGYAIRSDIATTVAGDSDLLPRGPVPLVALAAWMYRQEAVDGPEAMVSRVIDDLNLDPNQLIGPIYSEAADAIDTSDGFQQEPISDAALLSLIGAPPAVPPRESLGSISDIVARIEESMRNANVAIADGLVARVVRCWLNRDVAVLIGAPGTGKSTFAREFASACEVQIPEQQETVSVLVDPDYDASRLFGYLDLGGSFRPSEFTKRVLQTSQPLLPRVVILEEWNTAQVEQYLGPLLHAVEGDGAVQLPDGSEPQLPMDVLLLATCNSVRDEPETRLPISRPTKRRTIVIEMPNILLSAFQAGERDGLEREANQYLAYERERLERREGEQPALDELRAERLEAVQTLSGLNEEVVDQLLELIEYLFDTEDGQTFFTVGLFIDVVLDLIFAGEDAEEALAWQVVGKILEQVTDPKVARGLAERCAGLPNGEAVARAVARMDLGDGSVTPIL
jgi:MoxR-like ATPase